MTVNITDELATVGHDGKAWVFLDRNGKVLHTVEGKEFIAWAGKKKCLKVKLKKE